MLHQILHAMSSELSRLGLRSWFRQAAKPARAGFMLFLVTLVFSAVGVQAKIGVQYQMLLGNPSNASTSESSTTNLLIERDQYSFSYNDSTRQANWVSWNFTVEDRGGAQRKDNFIADPLLPASYTAVQGTSYSGSGYDRGHMCPSADRTATQADNDATFYMTNMVPQAPDNNQGVWANFENETRAIAALGNEMLIISGPSLFPGTQIASGVKIPGYVWKIVLVVPVGSNPDVPAVDRINASTRVIAIKIPNIQGVRSNPWQNYVTSIAQIEADTGFTFLTNLPTAVANALRVKIDGQVVTGSPVISVHPSNQTAAVGGTAVFSVTATGNATLAYQWFKGEDLIAGANSASLTLNNVQGDAVGLYNVVVSNGVGSATSNNAELIVTGLPPSIATPPAALTTPAGSTAIFTVTATGTAPFSYLWHKNGVAITGNASATTATLSLPNVQVADADSYYVRISNNVSQISSDPVSLTVTPASPTIAVQPASRSVGPNGTTSLSVVASGTAPLAYQWRKGDAALLNNSSASTSTLVLSNVQLQDEGAYEVVVSNTVGSVTSNPATVTISQTAGGAIAYTGGTYTQDFDSLPSTDTTPTSYTFAGIGPFGLDVPPINASGLGGWSFSKPTSGGGSGTNALFFVGSGTILSGGIYSFGVAGTNPLTDRALGSIASNSTASRFGVTLVNNTDQTISSVTVKFMTEQWRRGNGAVNKATGAYAIGASDLNTGTYINALALDITAPVITGENTALDGNAPANRAPATASLTELNWGPGDRLILRWTDINDALNDDSIAMDDFSFSAVLVGPSIDTQPAPQSANAGGTVTFTVAASGPGTLRYQWRKGTAPIAGATTASLQLTSLQPGDAGLYNVVVSNAGGSVTSADALLVVATGFTAWRNTNFTGEELANPAISGPNAVLTSDGLSNLMKYALGFAPKETAVALPSVITTGEDWIYTYRRPADRSDVTYVVERSTDLAVWNTSGVTHELVSSSDGVETWRATVAKSFPNVFFRLRITQP